MSPELSATYERDGVVCLRGCFNAAWVARAAAGLERQSSAPGPLSQVFPARKGSGAFLSHLHGWRRDPDVRAVALDSPLPQAVAEILGVSELRLFYDQSFTKEPGADAPTPWHQDLTFWPVQGGPLVSAWIALDHVDGESGAVHFLRGSHLLPERYRPTQPDTPETRMLANMQLPPAPDGWAVSEPTGSASTSPPATFCSSMPAPFMAPAATAAPTALVGRSPSATPARACAGWTARTRWPLSSRSRCARAIRFQAGTSRLRGRAEPHDLVDPSRTCSRGIQQLMYS